MNSNINWSDNRVLTSGVSQQAVYTPSYRRRTPDTDMVTAPTDSFGMMPGDQQGPPPSTGREYIPGYLSSLIGKNVRAEFLLGGSVYTDRTGIVREVGVNYFVLEELVSHALIMCDLYSVKFVTTV